MGLVDELKRKREEEKVAEKARAAKVLADDEALDVAIKVAEVKETKVAAIIKKCSDNGKALASAEAKKVEDIDDFELAKETVKISTAKVIDAERKCVAMEVTTKEVDEEGAFVMEPLLDVDEVELLNEVYGAKSAKTTKTTKGNGKGKKVDVLNAIKEGNNTKKGLEAKFGDVHSQTYQLTKDGDITTDGKGNYSVV